VSTVEAEKEDRSREAGSWSLLAPVAAFFTDLRTSLFPATEADARVVLAQLDMVRAGMRLLHYALPVAGGVIALLADVPRDPMLIWWGVLFAVCVGNETVLSRREAPVGDVIAQARARAWQIAVMGLVLGLVWSSVAAWTWQPGPEHRMNHLFSELILVMTLAVACTMLSMHAGTCIVPVGLIAAALVLTPALDDFRRNDALIGLIVVYVVLMLRQGYAIHRRVRRMLRLEQERLELIDRLRFAKHESDAARKEAEEASRAKSAFLANMSHELRTPLNAIIGFSDIIRGKGIGGAPDKYSEYGSFIHGSGHALLRLINDLLDIANIEAGRKMLQTDEMDLGVLVRDAVERAKETTRPEDVAIVCHVAADLPLFTGDARAIRQVVDNLLSNALKFSPPPARIEVCITCRSGEFSLMVKDNGIGIPSEEQTRIFERFGRKEPNVAKSNRGIGLGLLLVKALVQMHGGMIAMQSRVGQGTSVTITFPSSDQDGERRTASGT
jgi:two-component system cell cycle sensor histidine kinase PleC